MFVVIFMVNVQNYVLLKTEWHDDVVAILFIVVSNIVQHCYN